MTDLSPVYAYVDEHADRMVADLQRLIRQPSISSANLGVRECAELLVEMMGDVGITARVIETDGLPVVYGEINSDRPEAPTLLIYTHYDVQPADPESDWESPPFEARRVGDRIIGRGATDAKGNLMAHLKAVEALRATTGLPINVKFIFDGEEESGSPSLPAFVERHRDLLAADAALSFDGGFDAGDVPRVSLGTSGLLFVQMRARGGSKDLHSARARLVPNPAWKLVWALASIKGPDGRVRIEGFYDAVRPPTPLERSLLEQAGWDDEAQKRDLGVDEFLGGVSGVDALEQLLFTPTCNIAGFASGYVGEGNKTLLPATAAVNVDFRLVVDQDPADIFQRLRKHLDDHGFADVELHDLGSIEPSRVPADSPFARVVVEAARRVYGREPSLRPSESASGRQAVWLAGKLGIPGAGTGIGPPDWRGHAANEFITVRHYLAGIKYAATIWSLFGEG
ncbi:M20/M25/M40 family metallo-hydrolase [Sphaerobacter thermophilus]|uniref:M20/M25/M40 family metallo-hydrolase n=1 Tax=Sphaerobacter thermophilus TaxID=2057 RepID=UPI000DB23193|nr:MAG: peptidase M20 [Sphaerobacter thermophilus]